MRMRMNKIKSREGDPAEGKWGGGRGEVVGVDEQV